MDEEALFIDFTGSGDGDGPTIISDSNEWGGDPITSPV